MLQASKTEMLPNRDGSLDGMKATHQERDHGEAGYPILLWGSQMLLGAFLLDAAGASFSPGHFTTVSVTVESSSVSRVVGPEAP